MIKRFLYAAFLILVGWYVARHTTELKQVLNTVRHGIWYWILLGLLFQVVHFGFRSLGFKWSFRMFHMVRRGREMLPVTLSSIAINVAAPSMNVSGIAFMVDEARRRGHPSAAALVATMVDVIIDGGLFVVFAVGLAITVLAGSDLSSSFTLALWILLGLLAAVVGLIAYFWKKPEHVEFIARFMGKERAKELGREWKELVSMHIPLKGLIPVIAAELAAHAMNVASLMCVFLAFGISPFSAIPCVTYLSAFLFMIISPTPMGIGVVEGAMTVALVGQGIPLPVATAITLAYRGINFWLPFLVGAVLLHRVHKDAETAA